MLYLLINDSEVEEFNTQEEAIKRGNTVFNKMCKADKVKCEFFYVLKSANPDPDAEDHFDGDIVKIYK